MSHEGIALPANSIMTGALAIFTTLMITSSSKEISLDTESQQHSKYNRDFKNNCYSMEFTVSNIVFGTRN